MCVCVRHSIRSYVKNNSLHKQCDATISINYRCQKLPEIRNACASFRSLLFEKQYSCSYQKKLLQYPNM